MSYELQFNVAQLLKQASGSTRTHDVRAPLEGLDGDIKPLEPLTGRVTLMRTAQGVLARGRLDTRVELACARCLEPTSATVSIEVADEFQPTIDVNSGHFRPESLEAEEALRIDEHHILDLTEVVRQSLLVALPMHPVCRTECRGLCPVCGESRNEGEHEHAAEEVDPRLSRLRELL